MTATPEPTADEIAKAGALADLEAIIAAQAVDIDRLRELLLELSTYFQGAIQANILKAIQPKEGEWWITKANNNETPSPYSFRGVE